MYAHARRTYLSQGEPLCDPTMASAIAGKALRPSRWPLLRLSPSNSPSPWPWGGGEYESVPAGVRVHLLHVVEVVERAEE